jgi:hypothetical protein
MKNFPISTEATRLVIPAKAGIQGLFRHLLAWIPASAGMTDTSISFRDQRARFFKGDFLAAKNSNPPLFPFFKGGKMQHTPHASLLPQVHRMWLKYETPRYARLCENSRSAGLSSRTQ